MWAQRSKVKPERTEPPGAKSLAALVQVKQADIAAATRAALVVLRARLREQRAAEAGLTARADLRRRLSLRAEIAEGERRERELAAGTALVNFETSVQPLLAERRALLAVEQEQLCGRRGPPGPPDAPPAKRARREVTRRAVADAETARCWYSLPEERPLLVTDEEGVEHLAPAPETEAADPVASALGLRERQRASQRVQASVEALREAVHFQHDTGELAPRYIEQDRCPACHATFRELHEESTLVCPDCGFSAQFMDATSSNMPYGEEFELTKQVYKRTKNFRIFMNQFRKDVQTVPEQVIIDLKLVYEALHVRSKQEIRPTAIKTFLKQLGYPQYVDMAPRILRRINNTPIAAFTQEEIDQYVEKFGDSQVEFVKHKTGRRINFLNASYMANRLSDVLNKPWFKECFPLMKSRSVMKVQDSMWKPICKANGWPYSDSY